MSYSKTPDVLIARRGYSDQSGFLDDIGSGIKTVASGAVNVVTALVGGAKPATPAPVQQGSSMPSWVLPVAAGAGIIVVALIIRRRRKK